MILNEEFCQRKALECRTANMTIQIPLRQLVLVAISQKHASFSRLQKNYQITN